jgi:zinc transport system substrate-binding protein
MAEHKRTYILCLIIILIVLFRVPWAMETEEKIKVFVSILPQAYFAERVGGERVSVEVLVGPGQSPATYEPTPNQMAALAESGVYFTIGVPFERRLLAKIAGTMTGLNIVDVREGVKLRYMASDDNPEGREAGAADPHVWLDPLRVRIIAKNICRELQRLDPAYSGYFDRQSRAFQADLDKVHNLISETLSALRGKEFLVFHPAYGYFGDRYGLKQVAVEMEGKEPSARQMDLLVEWARKKNVRVIFVQSQFSTKSAEAVADAIGGVVVRINPLARDYLQNMIDMANKLAGGLKRNE